MTSEKFDLIIIGSGTGNSIPEYLSDWKIALVERAVFGGTCLNKGCIPSKMFVLPADIAEAARDSTRLGIDTSFNGVDWAAMRDRVFGRIDPIAAGGKEYRATGTPNVTLVTGTAVLSAETDEGDFAVDITDGPDQGRRLAAPKYLLAAGARPHMPAIEGLEEVRHHTSDSIMRLDQFPKRLGVIGGGFIAAEMGHVFSGLGSEVHLFNRSDHLLRAFDTEIGQRFTEVFSHRVNLHLETVPTHIQHRGQAIVIHYELDGQPTEIEVDELLVATGRIPNSDLLGAELIGLPLHDDGRVEVDETMATPIPGVFALGDLANPFQLKHLANAEGKVAFWNLAHPGDQQRMNYQAVPSAVFSDPQVATVGLTEEQAKQQNVPYVVGRRDYGGTAYGWALEDETSFAKVMVNPETGLLVGAHILGPQAATLIQPLIQAMQFNQPVSEVARDVLYIHPALTEVVENALLEALDSIAPQS